MPTHSILETPLKIMGPGPVIRTLDGARSRQRPTPERGSPISFMELFGNAHPVEVEIGSGKGKFLTERAARDPHINFLGWDWSRKWTLKSIERSEKKSLPNLKFIRRNAQEGLEALALGQVSVFHLYFLDPWPKRRHHKRRLITSDFLALLHERLLSGGLIEIATDHEDYWFAIRRAVSRSSCSWKRMRTSANQRIHHPEIKTHYELKYEGEGRNLYYLELEKS